MKVQVVVTDDRGNVFSGEAALRPATGPSSGKGSPGRKAPRQQTRDDMDFSLPVRPFMRLHAKSLGGPGKFTVLLAWLTKGKAGEQKSLKDIKKAWNHMTEPMGGPFNPAHTTRAKDNGWVDAPKPGFYVLRAGWARALGGR